MLDVSDKRPRALVFFSLLIFTLSCFIYAAFLHSDFQLDDLPNFSNLSSVHDFNSAIRYILDGTAGLRWLSYASYLLHVEAWKSGIAFPFKLVNLLIHSLNAGLLFFCTKSLLTLRSFNIKPVWHNAIAALIAALWFAHPVHVNTVLYSVQRMTLIAASFSFIGILFHFRFFAHILSIKNNSQLNIAQWFFYSATLAFITCLGILGKENAILLPALTLLLAAYTQQLKHFRLWQWLLTYIAPFVLLVIYLIISHRLGYGGRNFDMLERLMSQVVILQEYLFKLLIPNVYSFSLYYDGFAPVRHVFDPRFIQASVIWLAIFTLAWRLRFIAPALGFGLLWFFIGHSLEGTIIPLELYFDHRNYLPAVGIAFAVVVCSAQLLGYLNQHQKRLAAGLLTFCLSLLLANQLWISYYDSSIWQNKAHFEKEQMLKRPDSLRAKQGYMEVLFAEGRVAEAAYILEDINQQYGVHATHLMFQILAVCAAGNSDNIKYDAVIEDLSKTPFDMAADSALKSIFEIVIKDDATCPSLDLTMFRRYAQSLLDNPHMARHYHNFAWLLVHSYLHENKLSEALAASYKLSPALRSQQYWFLQISLAIFLDNKEQAQSLYDGMLQSKNVHHRLYQDNIKAYKKKIDAMP